MFSVYSPLYQEHRPESLAERMLEKKNFTFFKEHSPNLSTGSRILVIASGAGRETAFLKRSGFSNIFYLDIDFRQVLATTEFFGSVEGKKESLPRGLAADALNLPFGDKVFDAGIVYQGLHHFNDQRAFLAEGNRVCKSLFILSEPVSMPPFLLWLMQSAGLGLEPDGSEQPRIDLQIIRDFAAAEKKSHIPEVMAVFSFIPAGVSE